MTAGATDIPDSVDVAGLRTRLIARLIGVDERRLRYWHRTVLAEATRRAGSRGVPRLYSWSDYMRLRLIASLVHDDVSTRRIRRAVALLDEQLPDWYMLPERASAARGHVVVRAPGDNAAFIADAGGQFLFEIPPELGADIEVAANALVDLTGPGAELGRLREYADAVVMRPWLNIAKPTVRGTALETKFVREMAYDMGSPDEMARIYRIDVSLVRRAIEFEKAVA